MLSARAVRGVTLVICVLGTAGMIVTSILNHNGAAVTFGLITAVAVLCSMVARAVAAEAERRLGAPAATGVHQAGAASADPSTDPSTDALAELVEQQVQALIAAGADEEAVRQVVGEAVRLGRNLPAAHPAETRPR